MHRLMYMVKRRYTRGANMIKASEYALRREKVFDALKENSVAIVYAGAPKMRSADAEYDFSVNRNFYYLTGISQENSILVLIKSESIKETYLFIDEKDENKEKWIGIKLSIKEAQAISGINNVLLTSSFEGKLNVILNEELSHFGHLSTLYLDLEKELKIGPSFTTNNYKAKFEKEHPSFEVLDIYPIIASLRMIKSEGEIEMLKEAIKTTEMGLNRVLKEMTPGKYEYNLRNIFEFVLKEDSLSGLAFPTIVASGKNGVILHYPSANDVLNDNELVLMDCGASKDNYCADISRTYPINGKFTPLQKLIYSIVLECNKATINFIRPGLKLMEVKEFARNYLAEKCLEHKLIKTYDEISRVYYHGCSHYLGLDTHDVCDRGDKPLEPGNVITCEPGLYFKEHNIGVRIEDDILVTENGSYNLSGDIIKEVDDIENYLASK